MTEGLAQVAGPSAPHPLATDSASSQPASPSRKERRKSKVRKFGPSDLLLLPLVFVVGLVVTWLRAPWEFSHPQLWAEDGAVFFQSAYNQGWHTALAQSQAGYLQTFPRLVSDLGLVVPIAQVPLVFALVALAVQVLPAVLVASRRFATAVPDYRVRLLLSTAYLLLPNSREVNVDLTNSQWHLAVLAVLVVLAAPPTGLGWRVFDIGTVVLSGLTGPFVISLIVVVAIVSYRRRQRWTIVLGALVAAGAAVQLYELATAVRPPVGPLGITLKRFVEVIGGRLIGNTVLGSSTTTSHTYDSHLLVVSYVFLIVGLAIVAAAVWRGPFELKVFNLWAGLVLAGSLASPLAAVHGSQWQALISDAGGRYWLIPSLALVADVVWVAGQMRGWRRLAAVGAMGLLLVMAGLGVREDFRYPVSAAPSWSAQAERFDRLAPGHSFTFRTRPLGWTMTLYKK